MGVAATLKELSDWTLLDFVFVYLHFNIPLTRLKGLAVEM